MDLTAQQHIQRVIDDIQIIVEERPFHAFALLAIVIELLGKCLNTNTDWQHFEPKGVDFKAALGLDSLKKYQTINADLYNALRCGMAHALMPKEGIQLVPDKNDIANNIIGCKDLYEDIIDAWKDILIKVDSSSKMSKVVMEIDGPSSGASPEIKSEPLRK